MGKFDPDAYLANSEGPQAFDPDRYLSTGPYQEGHPLAPKPQEEMSKPEAALVGGTQGLTAGFSDELRGAIASPVGAAKEIGRKYFGYEPGENYDGLQLEDQDIAKYKSKRDLYRYLQDKAAADQPYTYYPSAVAGGLVSGGAGVKALQATGKAALPIIGGLGGLGESSSKTAMGDVGMTTAGAILPKVAEKGLGYAGKGLSYVGGKMKRFAPVSEFADKVTAGVKDLAGPEAKVPGYMLTDDRTAGDLASTLLREPTLAGAAERATMEPIKEGIERGAKELVSDAGTLSPFQAGESVKSGFQRVFASKLKPAEMVYERVEDAYAKLPINTMAWKRGMTKIAKDVGKYDFTGKSGKMLDDLNETFVKNIKTVGDLRKFRTQVGKYLGPEATDAERAVMGEVYGVLSRERNRSILAHAMKGTSKIGRDQRSLEAVKELVAADKMYSGALREMTELLPVKGGKSQAVRGQISRYLEQIPPEKLARQAFNTNDVGRLRILQSKFPEQFATLRQLELQRLVTRSSKDGVMNSRRLATNLQKYSPEVQEMLFGKNVGKAKSIVDVFSGIPQEINPSGTSVRLDFGDIGNPAQNMKSMANRAYLNYITPKSATDTKTVAPLFEKMEGLGRGIQKMATPAALGVNEAQKGVQKYLQPNTAPTDPEMAFQKLRGTPYEKVLRDASNRGAHSYATTYYSLSQDPKFRKALGE